jgi:metallo-beta-lactamase class B
VKALLALAALAATPAATPHAPDWTRRTAPFHVAGPIWYVGTRGLAAYLIRTPAGAILLDGTLAQNVPAIERSIAATGVPLRSVRILLNSHAHFDHAAGLARLKRDTGAAMMAMDADVGALDSGTPPSTVDYGVMRFPPVKVDRVLHDGDTVRLGGVVMTALRTPGHTPGCTSWTMPVTQGGRTLRVIFPCSLTVAGNRLVGNRGYPGIVGDFRGTFARLARVRADIVLPAHPDIADVLGRADRVRAGQRDAFVDPALLGRIVADARTAFDTEWRRRQAAR